MPSLFGWELRQYRDVLGRFTRASRDAKKVTRDMARDAGRLLVSELKKEAPVGVHWVVDYPSRTATETRPATLKNSIQFRTFSRPYGFELKIYAADHVKFVINDVKGHRITAKNRPVLTFYWPDAPQNVVDMFGGNIVHFKSVWIPARKANPFHKRALDAVTPEFQRMLQKYAGTVKTTLEG